MSPSSYDGKQWASKFARQTHYSFALYTDVLAEWAKHCSKFLPQYLDARKPIFIYSGMSGVAHATALSLAYYEDHGPTFGMIYCRKPTEGSHAASREEHSLAAVEFDKSRFVFVDDLIDSGATRERCLKEAVRAIIAIRDRNEVNGIEIDQEVACWALKNGVGQAPFTWSNYLPTGDNRL